MDSRVSTERRIDWRADDHFAWIKAGVAGWCDDGNIDAMATAVANMPAGAVIEIGSFVGRSTCIIARLLDLARIAAPFYTVDDWQFEGYKPGVRVSPHVTFDNWRLFTEAQFRANVDYFTARRPRPMKMRSDAFFAAWEDQAKARDIFSRRARLGGQIAFAFIDGDHSYAGCKRDVDNVLRFLAPSGFLLMDDSYEGTPHESGRVAAELTDRLPVAGRHPNLLFQRPAH